MTFRSPLVKARRLVAALSLVVVTLGSVLFTQPAGAGTREWRYHIHSNIHSFDVSIVHDWTAGTFEVNAWRYTKGFGAYLGHELQDFMPDWACPILEDRSGNQSDILHLRPNHNLGEITGDPAWQPWQPCYGAQVHPGPPYSTGPQWDVMVENGGFSAYDEPYTWSTKWAGPLGFVAFGYYAPLYGSPFYQYHALI